MHKQIIRIDAMTRSRMLTPIPRIRIRFGCVRLFEGMADVEFEECFGGACAGEVAT